MRRHARWKRGPHCRASRFGRFGRRNRQRDGRDKPSDNGRVQRTSRLSQLCQTVLAASVLLVPAACGDDDSVSLRAFAPQYARLSCQRFFECCSAEDRLSPGDPRPPSDAAMCAARREQTVLQWERALVQLRFDGQAARRCLQALERGPCTAVFSPRSTANDCLRVLVGRGRNGDHCDNTDQLCASHWCENDLCAPRPVCVYSNECSETQFCDRTQGCLPAVALGQSCSNRTNECGPLGQCSNSICTNRLADGQACNNSTECLGICSNDRDWGVTGTCRPARCQGT